MRVCVCAFVMKQRKLGVQFFLFHCNEVRGLRRLRGPAPKKRLMNSGSKIGSADFYLQSRGYRIGHYRNVRGLGKSMAVLRLFEKLRYSNERSTLF